jgi:hypothetical protein
MHKVWNNPSIIIPVRKLVLNYVGSSEEHPPFKCDRTVSEFSLLVIHPQNIVNLKQTKQKPKYIYTHM